MSSLNGGLPRSLITIRVPQSLAFEDRGYNYDTRSTATTPTATCASGEVSRSPSHYRGEQYDPDLGLYYLRARYYNPATGRFLSRDPEDGNAKDPASLHKYLYAGGDPVNAMDPTGRDLVSTVILYVRSVVTAFVEQKGICLAMGVLSAIAWSATGHTTGAMSTTLNDIAAAYAALSLICYQYW